METRGRKPSPNAKRKNIIIRFQQIEYNALQKYAKQKDTHVSTMIREITLNYLEGQNVPTTLVIDDPNQLKIETD